MPSPYYHSTYEISSLPLSSFLDYGTYGTDVFFMLLLITEGSIIVISPQ